MKDQKQVAIEYLKKLDIYKPYIIGFEKKDDVCVFENYGGFWVNQRPEIEAKMREVEAEFKCKVYAITHEYTEFGELYDFLMVTRYPKEWDYLLENDGADFYAFAYVWNKTNDDLSELGTVCINSFGSGIKRFV